MSPAARRSTGPWVAGAGLFAAFLLLNLTTAAPTVVEGDGAELQTVALIGGIPHAPGYPLWTMLGQILTPLLPGEPAFRVTTMNAVFGAAAVALIPLVVAALGAPGPAGLAAALLTGLSVTVRWSSIWPEVYALAILLFLIALLATLRAFERPSAGRILLCAALLGLATTSHFAFAPAAAVLAIALFVRTAGTGVRAAAAGAVAIAGGVLIGFLPYLYVLWVDASGHPMNYLNTVVDARGGMFGLTPQAFDDPWERIRWLLLGREARPFHYYADPGSFAWNAMATFQRQVLFETGPVVLPLALIGVIALARSDASAAAALLAVGAGSFLWAAALANARLSQTFQLPLTLALCILAGIGIGAVAGRAASGRTALATMLAIGLAAGAALVPHAIREITRGAPIRGMSYVPEGGPPVHGLLPSFRGYREPRETGEAALAALPPRALVIARWRDLTTLWYLREVEGRRPDIELDPVYRGHERRYARWQSDAAFRGRPLVLLDWSPEVAPYLGAIDSTRVTTRLTMYTLREPMRGLPPP